MSELTKNIRWKKIFIAGLIYMVIAMVIGEIEMIITVSYFKNPAYFGLWNKLIVIPFKSLTPVGLSFYLLSFLFAFAAGLTLALFYELIKDRLSLLNNWGKIFVYSFLTIWISLTSFFLPSYLLFNVPYGIYTWWIIGKSITFFLASIAFVKILKQEDREVSSFSDKKI